MVLVYSDNNKLNIELLSKGKELSKELGEKLTTIIIGKDDDNLANEYISYGAEDVYLCALLLVCSGVEKRSRPPFESEMARW